MKYIGRHTILMDIKLCKMKTILYLLVFTFPFFSKLKAQDSTIVAPSQFAILYSISDLKAGTITWLVAYSNGEEYNLCNVAGICDGKYLYPKFEFQVLNYFFKNGYVLRSITGGERTSPKYYFQHK